MHDRTLDQTMRISKSRLSKQSQSKDPKWQFFSGKQSPSRFYLCNWLVQSVKKCKTYPNRTPGNLLNQCQGQYTPQPCYKNRVRNILEHSDFRYPQRGFQKKLIGNSIYQKSDWDGFKIKINCDGTAAQCVHCQDHKCVKGSYKLQVNAWHACTVRYNWYS